MSKWWHVLSTIGIAAVGVLDPALHGLIVGNPIASTVLGTLWAILGGLVPSPVAQPGQKLLFK
jgi:hypothetical protein